MQTREPNPTPPIKPGIEADLARLHRAERRYWLTRCAWAMVAAVALAVAVTWWVMR